jgi:serine/threonine-protein kinase RsbW
MRMKIAFWLPRNAESVSVARHILDRIFLAFGVRADCREEIALALSEACTNAVRHGVGPPVYELAAESNDSEVVITVNDDGPGAYPAAEIGQMPDPAALSGRGLALMRVTTDGVEVRRRRTGGLSVRLSKNLRWADGALGSVPP